VRFGRIPELGNICVRRQQTLHGRPLYALAAAVNQAHDGESGSARRPQIFVDHAHDIARVKGVQVDRVLDRDRDRRLMIPLAAVIGHIPQ
jgi:hypothetical protein